jgi:hypothetical protein
MLGSGELKSLNYLWEMKLDRLQNRNEKILEELMKSKLRSEDKAELYGTYCNFISDIRYHLEKQYPYLKS